MNLRSQLNLPNLLTLLRIALVPIFLVFHYRGEARIAFWLFFAAAATDILDGLLARALRQQTVLGGWLDPFADKLLVFSAFFALTVTLVPSFPPWFTAFVLGRDVFIVAGIAALRVAGRRVAIAPTRLSKYATFFQTATLAIALAHRMSGDPAMLPYLHAVMALCAILALVSVVQYLWRGASILRGAA